VDDSKGGAKAEEKPAEQAKVPEVVSVLVKGRLCEDKLKWKSACISLDGLLDYDEEDRSNNSKIPPPPPFLLIYLEGNQCLL
jgi:hypothetical protein